MEGLVDAAFVINMDRAVDRMRHMRAQCTAHGIQCVRVPGVDASTLPPDVLRKHITPACLATCTPAVQGCALSHRTVWNTIVDSQLDVALVMEDDAVLAPNFVDGVKRALADVPRDWDVLVLGCFQFCDAKRRYGWMTRMQRPLWTHGFRDDPRVWGSVFVPEHFAGAHCYLVSAKGARALLRAIPQINDHIDMHMNHPDLRVYAVTPDLARQRDMACSSIAELAFPKTLNPFLGTVRDDKNISLAYWLSVPQLQVMRHTVNNWTWLFVALGLLRSCAMPYVLGFLAVETLVGGAVVVPVAAYLAGWAAATAVTRIFLPRLL
jgi:GR25 family glycosyltransferase involved in LPS biosynthesis